MAFGDGPGTVFCSGSVLFALPYGVRLILKTAVFQLTFGFPQPLRVLGEKFLDRSKIVPALLLFKDSTAKAGIIARSSS